MPKRAIAVSCPIHMDDGRTAVFQGFRVQHHLTLGPAKGGTRFAPDVDLGEVAALAIWMSWKCALAELPYGGGKGGVAVDPLALSLRELENLSRRYMQEMIPFVGPRVDVMAPDMGTNEQMMAWFMDTYSMYQGVTVPEIVTGKPVGSGGTLGRREATGHGVAFLAFRALDASSSSRRRRRAIVQGFGNVGTHAALGLAARGVRVTGISDHTIALHDAKGFDVAGGGGLCRAPRRAEGLCRSARGQPARLLDAALRRARALRGRAGHRRRDRRGLQCRIIAEGANGPTTPDADAVLAQRNSEIFVVPDILCNAGGVIVSYFEWVQDLQQYFWSRDEVMDRLERALERSGPRWSNAREGRRLDAHRGDGDGRRAGAGGEAVAGIVPVRSAAPGTRRPARLSARDSRGPRRPP